ncbi:UNVERIFIED_CONTAM: hypothetical protein FKN15_044877 [Acipenser sinensis]
MTKPASFFTQELESGCQRAIDLWRTKASLAGVCSQLTGRLTSRVCCRAVRRNSPCWFYLPNPRERLGNCDAPFGVPNKDQPTSRSQDMNLRCTTHPAHHGAALLPVRLEFSYYSLVQQLELFQMPWGIGGMVCCVEEGSCV